MPALQVRDFPDDLYEQLKAAAKREHRSIAQQTVACVEEALTYPQPNAWRPGAQEIRVPNLNPPADYQPIWARRELPPEQVEQRKKLFAEMLQRPVFEVPKDFPTPEELIREDRDTR